MSRPSDDLISLSEDLRALLEDYRLRGAVYIDVESELATTEVATEPTRPNQWSQLAKKARHDAVPSYARTTGEAGASPDSVAPSATAEAPAEAPAQAGDETLAQVRTDLGDCRRCRLCEGRQNIVFGVGDPHADLMVIGEGPGENEDRQGEPFVGVAGQMLDKMLKHVIGLERPSVYIANVVKCRPPRNRAPEPDEVAACMPFLQRQIAAVRPKILLILGSVALQHVMGVRGITRNRGREMKYRDEIPAIPTFHPAYLARKPEDKRLTFEDLKTLRRRYDELGGRRSGT